MCSFSSRMTRLSTANTLGRAGSSTGVLSVMQPSKALWHGRYTSACCNPLHYFVVPAVPDVCYFGLGKGIIVAAEFAVHLCIVHHNIELLVLIPATINSTILYLYYISIWGSRYGICTPNGICIQRAHQRGSIRTTINTVCRSRRSSAFASGPSRLKS